MKCQSFIDGIASHSDFDSEYMLPVIEYVYSVWRSTGSFCPVLSPSIWFPFNALSKLKKIVLIVGFFLVETGQVGSADDKVVSAEVVSAENSVV